MIVKRKRKRRLYTPGLFDEKVVKQSGGESRFQDRDYQTKAVNAVFVMWMIFRSTIIVMATGLGKTVCCVRIIERIVKGELRGPKRFLFLVHRDELVTQAYQTFKDAFPNLNIAIEQGESVASMDADVVVASKDTLCKAGRLTRFPKDHFGAMAIDECHHCTMKNKTYSTILMYFDCPYVGITATPDRLDGEALGTIFESVAYEYDILDGIRDGWLVPVTHRLEQCDGLDYSKIKMTKSGFDPVDLAEHMRKRESLIALVAAAVKYSNWEGGKRQTLIFCADRHHAVLVAEMLNARHEEYGSGEAAAIHYKTKKKGPGGRRDIIKRYKNREIRYLCNFGILTEGFDDDKTCIIVNGRPLSAKARALFAQIVGRGTRPLKEILVALSKASGPEERKKIIRESAKPGAAIVDLIGLNLKLICTMNDVLAGKRTCEKIEIPIDNSGGRGRKKNKKTRTPEEAAKLENYFKEKAEAERLSLEMARATIVDVNLATTIVDPFNLRQRVARREGVQTKRYATGGQVKALLRFGIPKEEASQMSQGEAGRVLKMCSERRKSGLCSYPQMGILRKFGYDPNLSSTQASEIIDRLAKNNWKKPNEDY